MSMLQRKKNYQVMQPEAEVSHSLIEARLPPLIFTTHS